MKRRARTALLGAVAALALIQPPAGRAQAQAQCRLALALGLDVSGSVDAAEYRLQLDGLAAALGAPEVQAQLFAVPGATVRIAVYEWSGPDDQRLLLDWTELDSTAAVGAAQAHLRGIVRTGASPMTAIGSAILEGLALLGRSGDCAARTLDLSGDGTSNAGPSLKEGRTAAAAAGVTVNGLVIGADAPRVTDRRQAHIGELTAYFRRNVMSGPGAFVETALGFEDFEAAMRRKLERELRAVVVGMNGPAPHGASSAR